MKKDDDMFCLRCQKEADEANDCIRFRAELGIVIPNPWLSDRLGSCWHPKGTFFVCDEKREG